MSSHGEKRAARQGAQRLNWLVTGASQGFGRELVVEALSRGDAVLAVVRNERSVADLAGEHGDRLTVVCADLRDPAAADRVAEAATTAFGAPDVLMNNAGRAIVGAAEEVSMAQLREQLELNFFACAALTKSVLPGMRARGRGTIVQMSSQGGRFSFPGVGAYSAGKFALEGWSEALAAEVAPFGIRVLVVEPSRFRTGFNTTHSMEMAAPVDAYAEIIDPVRKALHGADGIQEGDPKRAAVIITDLVRAEELPLRLPLGAEAAHRLTEAYGEALSSVRRWAQVARDADHPGSRDDRKEG